MSMFCFQCEQTAKGTGCTAHGVCGKDPETAALQDLLLYVAKGISLYANRARKLGVMDCEVSVFVVQALFATVTNVNFDTTRLQTILHKAAGIRNRIKKNYVDTCVEMGLTPDRLKAPADWIPGPTLDDLIRQGEQVGIESRMKKLGEDITGLQELLIYGLKGMAAYADHSLVLGVEDDGVYSFIFEALDFLTRPDPTVDELFDLVLQCGKMNLKVMGMLDTANTRAYGNPTPTSVRITPVKGKAILVSGHDLRDLAELLKQTEGKGINIYTHGEMLPAHGYPELKNYKHLVGNYGGAWQDQRQEFDEFPGAILMTTNCIQKPKDSYKGRIFTSGLVAWPDVVHIPDRSFKPVIDAALSAPGFAETAREKKILVGFGHNALLGVADKVVQAVKSGAIQRFFLVGGCDGAQPGRNYYTNFAQAVPKDCVILTLACGKYRFNKFDFGSVAGIPRLLDFGQCNDAYSAIRIADALAQAFHCGVNDLPLSFILSWYEQKAVCILLTLLSLGIKNIRLGPSLPAFITPNILKVLVEKFNIMPITTVEQDMAACLGRNG